MLNQPVFQQGKFTPEQVKLLVKVYTYILKLNGGEGDTIRLRTRNRYGKDDIEK